jgi:hypothetical protein
MCRYLQNWAAAPPEHKTSPITSFPTPPNRFIDYSYRKYVGKRGGKTHPWKDGFDMFTKRGYHMVPVLVSLTID